MKLPLTLAVPAALVALFSVYWVLGPGRGDSEAPSADGEGTLTAVTDNGQDGLDQAATPVGSEEPERQFLGELDSRPAQRPTPPGSTASGRMGLEGPQMGLNPRDPNMAKQRRQQEQRNAPLPLPPGIGNYEVQVFSQESGEALNSFTCTVQLIEGERPPVKFRHSTADGVAEIPVPRDQIFDLHVAAPGYETVVLRQLGFEFKRADPLQVALVRSEEG
jgi:hypothetical protein